MPNGFLGVLLISENTCGIKSDHPILDSGPNAHPKMSALRWFIMMAF